MKVLITAGSTQTPIDKVRAITNIFRGQTGTNIAEHFFNQGSYVTLLTSNPDIVPWLLCRSIYRFKLVVFHTFDQLAEIMEEKITKGNYDAIIHSAAISDYKSEKVFVLDEHGGLVAIDASKKVSSKQKELYLKLVPTIKLVDQIRQPWGFAGKLVKFKLEVGISDAELLAIAKKSRVDSAADLMVANCLEWADKYAYIIDQNDQVKKVIRQELPIGLYRRIK